MSGRSNTPHEDARVFGLDVLRALAVSCVVFAHSSVFFAPEYVKAGAWRQALFVSGHLGVEIFFVLSGFLIGRILLRAPPTGMASLWRFWARRWLRTLPPYVLVLLVLAAVFPQSGDTITRYLAFLQCAGTGNIPPAFFPVSWSLAVEEWFYLFLPFAVLLVRARPAGIAILLLIATVVRWYVLQDATFVFAKYHTWLRFDALLWGVLSAALSLQFPEAWKHARFKLLAPAALGVCAVVMICAWSDVHEFTMRGPLFTVTSMSFTCALPFASLWRARPVAGVRLIGWLAAISYPLYLVHLELLQAAAERFASWGALPGIGGALLVAWGMHRMLERPLLAWRDRRVGA